jgi:pimeloyl-ACP methyl ester carboxylesterase
VRAPEPLPTSDPEPFEVETSRGFVTCVDEGPRGAPALFAVHGIPGSVRDFRYLAPQLTAALRVVRIDLPGFGGSPPEAEAVATLPGRARLVVEVADRLGLGSFSVLGHSMGGGTALVTAARHRERVSKMVLVSSLALRRHRGLGVGPHTFAAAARLLATPVLGPLLLPWVRAQYRRRRFPGIDGMDRRSFAVQMRALAAVDFALLRSCVASALPPALVAYARDDHMIETDIAEELAQALPGAHVVAFDEGGHNLQKTRAAELGAEIRGFCSR